MRFDQLFVLDWHIIFDQHTLFTVHPCWDGKISYRLLPDLSSSSIISPETNLDGKSKLCQLKTSKPQERQATQERHIRGAKLATSRVPTRRVTTQKKGTANGWRERTEMITGTKNCSQHTPRKHLAAPQAAQHTPRHVAKCYTLTPQYRHKQQNTRLPLWAMCRPAHHELLCR